MTDDPFPKSSALIADLIRDETIRLLNDLLRDAVDYQRAVFEKPDAEINGGDLVEWFSIWRAEALVVLAQIGPVSEGGKAMNIDFGKLTTDQTRAILRGALNELDVDDIVAALADLPEIDRAEIAAQIEPKGA